MRTSLRALAALGSAAALACAVLPGTPAFASGQQSASCHARASGECTAGPIAVINPGVSGTIHVATSGLGGFQVFNCVRLKDNNTGVWVLNVNHCNNKWNTGDQSYWVPGLSGTSYTAYLEVSVVNTGTLYVANY